jgi:hypothetical protein
MKPSVIVWDLETVPDLGGFAAANDLVGKSDVEVREAIGDKFPKHIYHSIVCIGALIAHREPDHWAVDAVLVPCVPSWRQIDVAMPDLEGLNGRMCELVHTSAIVQKTQSGQKTPWHWRLFACWGGKRPRPLKAGAS